MRLHKPSVRLASLYLAIIMFISFFFSLAVYQLSIQELERGFRRQIDLLDKYPDFNLPEPLRDQIFNQRNEQYAGAKSRVFGRLVLINLVILVSGGVLSYYLARRTIRPIEDAHEAQSRFTADASHELRTPLAVMQNEIEVALMNPALSLANSKHQLRSNLEEVAKLKELSEKLLELAQLENSGLSKNKVSVKKIIKESVGDTAKLVKNKNIKIDITNQASTHVIGDQTRLAEVLTILISNSVKYSPKGSKIAITTIALKNNVKIDVKDEGKGIKKSEIPMLFDRFYQADNSRTKDGTGGYGLGLAIAKNIIELHGGSIKVISTLDHGSTFSIILPKIS